MCISVDVCLSVRDGSWKRYIQERVAVVGAIYVVIVKFLLKTLDMTVADMLCVSAGGEVEAHYIWSNTRTKSFKRNNNVNASPLPVRW